MRLFQHPIAWLLFAGLVVVSPSAVAAAPAPAPAAPDADLINAAGGKTAEAVDEGTGKELQERIRAVSRRTFLKANRFELDVTGGLTTNDPFFQAWAFGARGAWHFNEEFALDVGGSFAPFSTPSDAFRVSNKDIADLSIPRTNTLVSYVDGGVTFSPVYGKVALASEFVAHFDAYVSGGVALFVDGDYTQADTLGFHPAAEIGIGGRVYLSRWFALRGDVRDYVYPSSFAAGATAVSALVLGVGAAFYFPMDFDYSAETLGAKG